jgi:hypothetical protein
MCRSQQRQRRTSFSSDSIAEMRRRAALSYKVKPVAKVGATFFLRLTVQ